MKKSIVLSAIIIATLLLGACFGAVELKQSTAVTVKIGPFTDITDGTTRKTALTITQGSVWLSKAGGAMVIKNDSSPLGNGTLGVYDCNLNATDTGTLGPLRIDINDINAVPVWADFQVVDANYFNTKYAGTKLPVNAAQIEGTTFALSFAGLSVADPNTDPNSWNWRDWCVYGFKRWGNKTALDHSTNIFTTYDSTGTALVVQPVTEANNVETIQRIATP